MTKQKERKKKKSKVAHLSEEDYQKYLSSLKEDKPPKVIVNGKISEYK